MEGSRRFPLQRLEDWPCLWVCGIRAPDLVSVRSDREIRNHLACSGWYLDFNSMPVPLSTIGTHGMVDEGHQYNRVGLKVERGWAVGAEPGNRFTSRREFSENANHVQLSARLEDPTFNVEEITHVENFRMAQQLGRAVDLAADGAPVLLFGSVTGTMWPAR